MDSREKFIKAYTRFLIASGDKGFTAESAEQEAQRVADMIDCDEYMGAAESEYCQLCANDSDVRRAYGAEKDDDIQITAKEPANSAAYAYAKTDVAKDTDDGTVILPIAVPVCKRCRKNHLIVQYVPTVICVLVVALTLIITNVSSVKSTLYAANLFVPPTMRPFFIFAVVTAIAVIGCAALRKYLIQLYSAQTVFNPLNIKRMSFLSDGEWEKLYKNRSFKMMFDREKPDYLVSDEPCCGCDHDAQTEEQSETHTDDCCCCDHSDEVKVESPEDGQNPDE